ncbi:MAG: TIGR03905 family TSCPD domain-containing protein [Bacteroidales bacterium]|nr:TIGR03905 family TSCPD domain-containing protein [Bacteroidales bacterium]
MTGEDYRIITDRTVDGVRYIVAEPSAMVCSERIEFQVVEGKVHGLRYERGCNGNLQAIGRLLEGMPLETVVEKLRGVDCHGRGTSCTDQLARVVASIL